MDEVILIIAFVGILFGVIFLLRKIPRPAIHYIRIAMAVLLLALAWWDRGANDNKWVTQIIITLLATSSLVREFFNLKKFYAKD